MKSRRERWGKPLTMLIFGLTCAIVCGAAATALWILELQAHAFSSPAVDLVKQVAGVDNASERSDAPLWIAGAFVVTSMGMAFGLMVAAIGAIWTVVAAWGAGRDAELPERAVNAGRELGEKGLTMGRELGGRSVASGRRGIRAALAARARSKQTPATGSGPIALPRDTDRASDGHSVFTGVQDEPDGLTPGAAQTRPPS